MVTWRFSRQQRHLSACARRCQPLPAPMQAQAKRDAIRRTWLQYARDHLPGMAARFILAQVRGLPGRGLPGSSG